MRKIEDRILDEVARGIEGLIFTSKLTVRDNVESTRDEVVYRLWGTPLLRYYRDTKELFIGPNGWSTNTTTSRVKALYRIVFPCTFVRKLRDDIVVSDGKRELFRGKFAKEQLFVLR